MRYSALAAASDTTAARYFVVCIACALTFGLTWSPLWISPTVSAAPALGGEGPAPDVPLRWPDLGLPEYFSLSTGEPEKTVVIPAPAGYRPAQLMGQVESVLNAVNCRIDVFDGLNTYLGPITVSEGQTVSLFSLDLSHAFTGHNGVELRFNVRRPDTGNAVRAQIREPSMMRLGNLAFTFAGEPPTVDLLADFLPQYLSRVIVRVDPNPSPSIQQAALTLVANLTHLYRPIPVRIDLDSTGAGIEAGQVPYRAVRNIVLREDSVAEVALADPGTQDATVVISGTGDQLLRQVELFSDRTFGIGQNLSLALADDPQFPVTAAVTKTFGELKLARAMTFFGTHTLYLSLDTSEFGAGSITGADINMQIKHTPVSNTSASVVIRAGSDAIASYVVNNSGHLRVRAHIPRNAIQSNVRLGFELRYAPNSAGPHPPSPINFDIQPESTVTVTKGTPADRGFSMLPMAFSPEFDVAITRPDYVRFAAAAVNVIGHQTATCLRPHLITMDDTTTDAVARAAPGLLAVGPSDELSRLGLRLPISRTDDQRMLMRGRPSMVFDLLGPVGVIQTQTSGNRTILAISGVEDWSLVDRGFDFIRSLPGQWADLKGDVVATGAQGRTVNLSVDLAPGVGNVPHQRGLSGQVWMAIIAVGVLVAGGVGWRAYRNRRRDSRRRRTSSMDLGPGRNRGRSACGPAASLGLMAPVTES